MGQLRPGPKAHDWTADWQKRTSVSGPDLNGGIKKAVQNREDRTLLGRW